MMKWIKCSEQQPPTSEPFLVYSYGLIEMMEWSERIVDGKNEGFFRFHKGCACCPGFCSTKFNLWMPLPEPPEEE